MEPNQTCFIFIIDTENYAGNFEREMCAYLTGQLGDCEVGNDYRILYNTETKKKKLFEDKVLQVPDEYGCNRPVSVWPTPGWGNDGMGVHEKLTDENKEKFHWPAYMSVAIFFEEKPTKKMIDLMKERVYKFSDARKKECEKKGYGSLAEDINITGCRLIHYKVTVSEEALNI